MISEQRETDLKMALNLIEKRINFACNFKEYNIVFGLTNECLQDLWSCLRLTGDTGLCVLSSGDQMLSLIYKGINKMDTFDINRLTEYYAIGFKKRAIECLNYEQFIKLFSYCKKQKGVRHYYLNPDLEKYVIENMEEDYKWFWQEFLYSSKSLAPFDPNTIFLLTTDAEFEFVKEFNANIYLNNKKNYQKLQQNLLNTKITFKQMDIINMPQDIGNFDIIFLSNIFDYYEKMFHDNPLVEAIQLAKNIYDNNLNEGGQLIFTKKFSPFFKNLTNECYADDARLYDLALGWKKNRSKRLIKN